MDCMVLERTAWTAWYWKTTSREAVNYVLLSGFFPLWVTPQASLAEAANTTSTSLDWIILCHYIRAVYTWIDSFTPFLSYKSCLMPEVFGPTLERLSFSSAKLSIKGRHRIETIDWKWLVVIYEFNLYRTIASSFDTGTIAMARLVKDNKQTVLVTPSRPAFNNNLARHLESLRTPQVPSKYLRKYVIKKPNQMAVYVDLLA